MERDVGEALHALIKKTIPNIETAVRWNSPFYGRPGMGWFISYHGVNRYVRVTFLRGSQLDPLPPEGSKDPDARYVHFFEGDVVNTRQMVNWIEQSAAIPGWIP